jgi:branched-chain amino acid transport system permease protein
MAWVNAVVQGFLLGGLYAIFACGLSLMFGVMRIVNLAHGDLAMVAAFLAFTTMNITGVNVYVATVIVVPLFAGIGYLVQRGILQRSLSAGPFSTLLATFGLSIVIQNVLLKIYTADSHGLPAGKLGSSSWRIGPQLSVPYLGLATFVLAIAVLSGLQVFLSRTGLGRMIRATSDDQEAAQLSGANVKHVYGVATAIAFATVALAGLLFSIRSSFSPSTGPTQLLYAFEAVVIGGLGSLWGTLVGGIVLGLAQTIGGQINPAYNLLAGHLIFLAVLAFRPRGLIAARAT